MSRTLAMNVACVGCLAMAGVWLSFLLLIIPADSPEAPALRTISIAFTTLFGLLGAAGLLWTGARRRAGFWVIAPIVAVGVLLLNAPFIPGPLAHPEDTQSFLLVLVLLVASAAILVGGFAATRDAASGTPGWSRTGRAGFIVVATVAALLGAAATSVLAGAAGGAGKFASAPTVTGTLRAVNTTFAGGLMIRPTDVLGLFVVNEDGYGHQFDIDSLGIHVALPARTTVVVAVRPTGPGPITFYCAVPGHREAGMAGTINVE